MKTMKEKMTETVDDMRDFISRVCAGKATPEETRILPEVAHQLVFVLANAVIEEPPKD
jgi:hypothetical protein